MFHFGRKSNSTAESHAPKADQKKIEVAELVAAGDDANRNRDWPRAEQAYRSALDVSPDLAHIWVQFGHSLKEQGRLPEAETAYRKASELKPEDADAMLQLGHLLKLRARYDEALTAYRKSHELAPESADARTEVTWMEQFLASKVGSAKAGEAHNETRASDYVQGQSTDVSDMVPEVIGTIERVADTYVEGWARATNRQSNVILVELLIDGVSVGITEANLPRPDLAEKGAGSSNCGFRCAVPAKLCDGKFHTITARALGIPLANSASTTGLVRLGFSLPALFIHSPEGKSPSIGAEPLQAKVPEVEGARAPKSCLHLKPGGGGLVDLFPLRSSAGSVKNLIFALCRSEEDWRSLDRFTQELELRDYNVIIVAQSGTANASAGLSGNFSECERYILIEYAQPADEFAAFLQLFNSECLLEYSWIGYINFSGFDPEKEESAIPAYVTQFDRPDVLSSRVTYLASVATQEVKRFLGTCLPRIGRSFRGDDIRIPCGTVTWIPDILYRQARALPIGAQELRTAAGDTKNLHQPVLALLGALASDGGLLVSGMNVRSWANSGRQSTKHIAPLTAADTKIKAIAFYLPQFHPIAENDRWWGRGFTEWSNVLKGRPLFRGHHQPRLPGELGFYDLRVPDVQEQQARLARENGVYGFCYYYYWFNGQKLLNRPIEQMLRNHAPAQPFCVCWANENWSRNWDGQNRHVLLRQDYSIESNRELIKEFITMMRDPRYIRYQGKPVVVVYRISVIPNWPETAAMWREECRKAGIGEIHLCAVRFGLEPLKGQPSEHGLDAYVLFPPHELERHDIRQDPREQPHDLAKDFNGELVSYDVAIQGDIDRFRYGYPWPVHRGVTMNWDNTARRGTSARIFYGATPLRFRHWLNAVVEQELEFGPKDESLLFINAWNEWAEGTVLEPDQRYADTYLRVVRRELARYSEPFIATEVGRAYLRASNERSKTKQTEVAHAYSPVAQVKPRQVPSFTAGRKEVQAGRPTVLVSAHISGHQLFGGERSFLDVLGGLARANVNVVVTLPSGNAGAYVEAIRDLSTGVYVFHYPQWYAQRDADEYFTTCFCDIIVKHDIDLVYANTCVLLEPLIAAKRMGRRRLVHTREIITLDAPLQKRIGLSGEEIIQEVFGRTDYIIANSKATYDIFSRRDRTFYVPNAVNVDDFNMTNEVGDKIVFGIVSSNIPKKGIEDFVAVANECQRLTNKAEFAIIGPDNDYVRSLLNDGAAANIRFLGYYDSPVTAISKVNVLMNLSHFAESFGRTVAEAMAARRPVIAYEWGAVPELVDHEVTGLLAPYRDIAEVAQHVVRLCENKSLITSYGEKGRQRVIEKFSTECLARAVDQAMGSIFGAPTGRMSELLQWEKVENKPERVSVVIPVYNAFEEVSECLQQIERYTDLSSTRIFVINDASPDERISEVLNSYRGKAGFEIVENEKNLGYTRTINKGIELAGRDDVILLNSDAFVTPNWISGLRIAAYRGSDIGTVTAMSDNAGAFSFPVMGERNLRPEHFTAEEFSLRMVRATGQCDPIEVPTGSGFCMYIRRALIDAIGLFDAETFAKGYGEENDYCMRALSAGWRNVITPWAYVYHERNASFKGQKILLLEQGLASVEARYPKYTALTKESFASKAMRKLREAAQSAYNGDST